MLFLLFYLLTKPFSLEAAESVIKTFTVTVEAAENVSVSGNETFSNGDFSYNGGVMEATKTTTTMDLQSPSGSTRVLNVSYDSLPSSMSIQAWIQGGTGISGTGTRNYTSSGSAYTLTATPTAFISGMDDYSFTAATLGFIVRADPTAPASHTSTVTWTIAAP